MSSSSRGISLDHRCQTEGVSSRSQPDDTRRATFGAVLAGGLSTRMGVPKATIELGGRPLASYPAMALAAAGLRPAIVAKEESSLPDLGLPVIREPDPTPHPAAGVLAALRAADGPVVIVACDMPLVPAPLLRTLAELPAAAALPEIDSGLQPLLARYEPAVAPALERAVEQRQPLRDAVGALEPLVLGPDELAGFGDPTLIAFNVNDRDDLEAAERLMAPAPSA
jgi:molybdopterin-guanine dinucleotide biosynthesis protein A